MAPMDFLDAAQKPTVGPNSTAASACRHTAGAQPAAPRPHLLQGPLHGVIERPLRLVLHAARDGGRVVSMQGLVCCPRRVAGWHAPQAVM